jgi:hypothetical protein
MAGTERVVVEAGGVRVDKRFEPDGFRTPAVAFMLASGREQAVEVRLVESVPEGVQGADIRFSTTYGSDCWSVAGGDLVFERSLGPAETFTTLYELAPDGVAEGDRFMTAPSLTVTPPLPAEADPLGASGSEQTDDDPTGTGDTRVFDASAGGDPGVGGRRYGPATPCANCGYDLAPVPDPAHCAGCGVRVCGDCGADLSDVSSPRFCPDCGAEVPG